MDDTSAINIKFTKQALQSNGLIILVFIFCFLSSLFARYMGWNDQPYLPVAWLVTGIAAPVYIFQQKIFLFKHPRRFLGLFLSNLSVMFFCLILWNALLM